MNVWGKRIAAVCAVVAVNLILYSCASGPRPPEKGTPAFYWLAAKESYAAGDYLKTIDNLEQVVTTENEHAAQAMPWLLVLTSGMTRGYMEISDQFETGARINKADPASFRRQMSQNRNAAARMSLSFAEKFAEFQKSTDEHVVLAFDFPGGSAAPVGALAKLGAGMLASPAEVESAVKTALTRSVLLEICATAGSPEDPARARELFKTGEVRIPRAQFVQAMASAMHDSALMYGRNKLDDPNKLTIFCTRAEEALKGIPESKESKELLQKIQGTIKKSKS
jgi:hypothetical protein